MKLFSALALTALLSTTAVFAQTTSTTPTNALPTTSMKLADGKPTLASCKKMAADKKLPGADKTEYIKDCRSGKPTH
jgi:hypothetical protein